MNQRLLGWIFALAIVILVLTSLARGDFVTAGACLALFFLAPMVVHPDFFWTATIITLGSGISLGLHGGANLHLVLMLGFVILTLIKLSISSRHSTQPSVTRKACGVLILIVVFTATWRGWGLKMLESNIWGGMQYVSLIAALLFYIYSTHAPLSHVHLKRTLQGFFIVSFLPAAALLLVRYIPDMAWIRTFIEIGDQPDQQWQASEVTRWAFMQYPAIWIGVAGLFLYDRHSRITPMVVLTVALSFIMLGLSGHRTVVVLLGLTVLVYMAVRQRTARFSQFLKFTVVLTLLLAALYYFVGKLPLTFQRPFAWLPGIGITYEAGASAAVTSQWRIELWRQLLPMVPDYLWVGRGMAFNAGEANAAAVLASDRATQYMYFAAIHNYHNGPLWLVLDLGVAGFVAGVIFMLGGVVRYGRALRRIAPGEHWQTAYVVFYSLFTGYCIFFFAVIGGGTYLCHILVLASILEVIVRSSEAEEKARKSMLEPGKTRVDVYNPRPEEPLPKQACESRVST